MESLDHLAPLIIMQYSMAVSVISFQDSLLYLRVVETHI